MGYSSSHRSLWLLAQLTALIYQECFFKAILVFCSVSFEALIAECGSEIRHLEPHGIPIAVETLVSFLMNQVSLMCR